MAKRFVVDDTDILINKDSIKITGGEANHIKVLRYRTDDEICVNDYLVKIEKISSLEVCGKVLKKLGSFGIPKKNITLVQSYLKSDKMEYVVQKAVELGVSRIQPVLTKNTVVKFENKDVVKKVERLNRISKEAIGQCGRTDSVEVLPVRKLQDVNFSNFDLVLICHEKATLNLYEMEKEISGSISIAVIVGPEGGIDEQEILSICKNKNTRAVFFGQRILRAETASLYILSILNYLGEK